MTNCIANYIVVASSTTRYWTNNTTYPAGKNACRQKLWPGMRHKTGDRGKREGNEVTVNQRYIRHITAIHNESNQILLLACHNETEARGTGMCDVCVIYVYDFVFSSFIQSCDNDSSFINFICDVAACHQHHYISHLSSYNPKVRVVEVAQDTTNTFIQSTSHVAPRSGMP